MIDTDTKTRSPGSEPNRLFPPAFPFLLLPPRKVRHGPVAILPDSRFPGRQKRLARWWARLVNGQQAAGKDPLAVDIQEELASELFGIVSTLWEFVIAWTANDISVVRDSFGRGADVLRLEGSSLFGNDEVDLDDLLDAPLIDDPRGVVRRWKLAEPVARLRWDGGRDGIGIDGFAGFSSVYRTAGGFWADWTEETGEVYGPYADLEDALSAAGVCEATSAMTFALDVDPAYAGHPAVLDALVELAQPPVRGVWFNGQPQRIGRLGLLRPTDDRDEPLGFVP